MMTILAGPPGFGKTCLLTYMACEIAFNRPRTHCMQKELYAKIDEGFSSIKTIPPHCVSSNYDMQLRKFGYSPRVPRRINPFKLGFDNKYVKTHFTMPYEAIFITEAQRYFNSRMSHYFPAWQSRFFEQHRHNNLDIFMDTQRPMLIDVNIRDISQIIEIRDLSFEYDRFGQPCTFKWLIRRFLYNALFEKYTASGQQDTSCFTEECIVADYNIFKCYDSQCCKPLFYKGHLDEDFDYVKSKTTKEKFEDYLRFLIENEDEIPEKYYIKGVR